MRQKKLLTTTAGDIPRSLFVVWQKKFYFPRNQVVKTQSFITRAPELTQPRRCSSTTYYCVHQISADRIVRNFPYGKDRIFLTPVLPALSSLVGIVLIVTSYLQKKHHLRTLSGICRLLRIRVCIGCYSMPLNYCCL